MPEMKFESVILHVCLISVRLNPSHVHLKCAHTDPRSGPRSRQPNEVLAADVAGKQRGADLYERQREVFCDALLHVYTSWKEITYRKPEHVSAGDEEATDRVPVLPEHRLKRIRHIGLQV